MIKKDKHTFKYGTRTQIRVVEGYRPSPGAPVKHRTIKNFGYLEDQKDPIKFMKEVEEFNKQFRESKHITITHPTNKKFNEDITNIPFNYGYKFLEAIYDALKIKDFFREKEKEFKGQYSLDEIFRFLVLQRILNPDSKRATIQKIQYFYNQNYDFNLADIYRALTKFDEYKIELQKYINDQIKNIIGRDSSYAFYDVTNYYFEKDFPNEDGLGQKGISKEHQLGPIVQLGLFIDSNGIPISMSLFKGNTSDSLTLQPVMKEIKANYELDRLIVVADKGLNSSKNIDYICNNGDGYVVSQILRGKKGTRYHQQLFDEEGYVYNSSKTFKYKIFEEDYTGLDSNGNKVTRKRKVLIYWKKDDEDLARAKRFEKISRAKKSLLNNAYSIDHSSKEYIKETPIVKSTGEVCNKVIRNIDEEKVAEESKFDGYFCIVTSELDYDYKKILEVYSGLWKIEESFRITKSELEARPIYVSTNKHIQGHFLVCYVSLVLLRMLQYKLGKDNLSVERIVDALNSAMCEMPGVGVVHILRGKITKDFKKIQTKDGKIIETLAFADDDQTILDFKKIVKAYGIDFFFSYSKQEDFNKYLESIKYINKK